MENNTQPPVSPESQSTLVDPQAQFSGAISNDNFRQAVEWGVQDGHISREQADIQLRAEGLEPDKSIVPPDEHNTDLFQNFPPAKAHEYEIPRMSGPNDRLTSNEFKQVKEYQKILETAQFDSSLGSVFAAEVKKVSDTYQKMNPSERELWTRSEHVKMTNTFGPETSKKIELAQRLVEDVERKTPGLKAILDSSGASGSAMVMNLLASHAERLLYARGSKP